MVYVGMSLLTCPLISLDIVYGAGGAVGLVGVICPLPTLTLKSGDV